MKHASRAGARALLLSAALAGMVTPVRARQQDTIPRQDTTRAAAPDSLIPPPILVPWPGPAATGWSRGVWSWDRDALAREGALTLLELLRSVPGVTTFRAGVFVQPEAATFHGGGAGRTEIEIDGFVLDPLTAASLDISTLELAALEHVRVERSMGRLRVVLRTLQPEDARTFSRIEAGVGEPRANLFRGLLLAPRVIFGPLGFAIERVEAQGAGRLRPADTFATWVKWGLLRPDRGVQLEWRSARLNREPESAIPLELQRRDLVVRGRNRFAAGVIGEAWAAWSDEKLDPLEPAVPDSLRSDVEESSRQLGLRAALERERFGAEAAVRLRNHPALARWQADFAARAAPLERADLSLRLSAADWRTRRTRELAAGIAVRPLSGIELFAEYVTGEAGAPVHRDTARDAPAFSDRTAWRAGLELNRFGIDVGAAALHAETDSVPTFGLPGDSAVAILPGGSVDGWEAFARVPLGFDWLSASVAWTTWTGGTRWASMPASSLRAALELHAIPLPSGNLELVGRLELLQRGALGASPELPGGPLLAVAERTQANGYIQIRIIDVRLFIRFDDMQGGDVLDLPGLPIRGPRIVYGVKWTFWN